MSLGDAGLALLTSVGLIVLSAFFVASEFAVVASRRHRLEEAAGTSRSARAALRSARELSMLLAGSQLGITLCTLGLGAVSKPAVHDTLMPLLTRLGLPEATADVVALLLALALVTFVHLVVGEMAPKSWAIAHPERSATLLALPLRGFLWLTRPLLVALNGVANWCLHRVGVEPVDELSTGHGPDELRQLLDHSAEAGTLDADRHDRLSAALELHTRPLRDVVPARRPLATVSPKATRDEIILAARDSGHLRLVVRDGDEPLGVVHVRDVLTEPVTTAAAAVMRPVLTLPADTPSHAALATMRDTRNHLALLRGDDGVLGVVTMHDLLDQLLPAETG